MKEVKDNVCGKVGLCVGWLIPLAGVILGIIALCRKEPQKVFGILAIIVSIFFWLYWILVYL